MADRTDRVTLGWLAVLTVIFGVAFALMWVRLSHDVSSEQVKQRTQIAITRAQIIESDKQLVAQCKSTQDTWDTFDRVIKAATRLPAGGVSPARRAALTKYAVSLRAELHARPKCPTIAATTTTVP